MYIYTTASVTYIGQIYSTEAELFIHHQVNIYKATQKQKNHIEKTLKYQQNIIVYNTIPKHYKPRNLPIIISEATSTDLNTKFMNEYETLFSSHLKKVITHNTVNLEIINSKLTSISQYTENQLTSMNIPAELKSELQRLFKAQCNPDAFHTAAEPSHTSTASSSTTKTEATTKLGKHKHQHMPPEHQSKKKASTTPSNRHFLDQGPLHNTSLT